MICAAVVLSAALANRISVVQDFKAGDFGDILNRANDADDFVNGASAFYSLTQLVIVVLFIIWQFRAAKNNEALDRPGARFGPGWSIGGWFIPLANLAIPVLIMQDLWRGATPSVPRGDPRWRSAKGSWLVGVWWAVWVISLLRFAANNSGLHGSGSLDDIETSNIIALVGVIATAIAAVLAAFVVWTLSRRQLDTLRAQRRDYEDRRWHGRGRALRSAGSDAEEPLDRLHRFVDLGVARGRIGGGGVAHAVAHVLVEQTETDALQRLRDRHDLREHVDAVLVVVDHPLQAAHLAFDAAQPLAVVVLLEAVAPHRHGVSSC